MHIPVQSLDSSAFGDGAVLGCDFVGIVEKLGDKVSSLNVGDRMRGEIPELGAYAQYTVADEKICFKVPEQVDLNDAATVPLASATAWLALYSEGRLNIPRKQKDSSPVLIWGGSSSVGAYAIQLARINSIPIVTVCSPRHFDLCKSLGATHVFDYHHPDIVEKIKSAAPSIAHVLDCIGSESSSHTASQTVTEKGGVLCAVRPGKQFTDEIASHVKATDVLDWTWPASVADHNLGCELFKQIPGGLSAVPEGFQMHRDGKVSGFKLVYEL
ncbi:NAD(P)-binding protein [Cadophora sp. DSE1049]|nr:NAD(P)-binding protein [Cadophora sp. DSE1049]